MDQSRTSKVVECITSISQRYLRNWRQPNENPALSEPWNGTIVPSRAYAEGGIHEAIAYYEDNVFYEILAEELSRRDMNYPEINEENYQEIMDRMQQYMEVFQISGVDRLILEEI